MFRNVIQGLKNVLPLVHNAYRNTWQQSFYRNYEILKKLPYFVPWQEFLHSWK